MAVSGPPSTAASAGSSRSPTNGPRPLRAGPRRGRAALAYRRILGARYAEDRDLAAQAIKTFTQLYVAKFPKAVKNITDDEAELLAFYDFPAEHWIHLRTTNPIESTFATVRLRTKVTRGAGSRTAALAVVFKLVESAQQRWRAVNAPPPRRPCSCRGPLRTRPTGRASRHRRGIGSGAP